MTGAKQIAKPDVTTAVRDEAERSSRSLLSLWAPWSTLHKHVKRGLLVTSDASTFRYGKSKQVGMRMRDSLLVPLDCDHAKVTPCDFVFLLLSLCPWHHR